MRIKRMFTFGSQKDLEPSSSNGSIDFKKVAIPEDEEIDDFIKMCDEVEGWKERYQKNNISVYTKHSDDQVSKFKIIKARAFYDTLDPELIYDVIQDPKYRKLWDKMMLEAYDIGMVGPCSDLTYYSAKLPTPIKNRDFLVQRFWRVSGDFDEVVIKLHSVSFPSCPEKPEYIRGNTLVAGYYIQKLSSGCILTYIAQTDPKGSMPAYFVNKLVTKLAPSIMTNLKDICANYPEWKKKHHPDFKPWRNPEQNTLPFVDVESQTVIEKNVHPFLRQSEDLEDDEETLNAPHFGLEDLED
eukprot:Nk52_evm52s32 gene=Nk52_evmTU52s32